MPIQNTDQIVDAYKGKPRAILYFQRDHQEIAKQIAGHLRANNKMANMVFAGLFQGPEDCEQCEAVAIQCNAPKVHFITKCYKKTFPGVELHYFNSDGEFVDAPEIEDEGRFEMPNLKKLAAAPVEPKAVDEAEVAATKAALTGKEDAEKNETVNPATVSATVADSPAETTSEPDSTEQPKAVNDKESKKGNGSGEETT